ncbi:hypothetical protein VPHK460_0305 [Vibrio phage K460]
MCSYRTYVVDQTNHYATQLRSHRNQEEPVTRTFTVVLDLLAKYD